MKTTLLTVLVLVGLTGLTTALAEREEAFAIDLSSADEQGRVHAYYLKCESGQALGPSCGVIRVYENTNGVLGLQTKAGFDYAADLKVLPY